MNDKEIIAQLVVKVTSLTKRLDTLEQASGLYADDKDLDSQYGDPVLRFAPRAWKGAKYDGKRYSECPPELLDLVAEYLAWSAANPKPDKLKYVPHNLKDARRARSWAKRLRAGWKPSAPVDFDGPDGDAHDPPDDGFHDAFDPPEGF